MTPQGLHSIPAPQRVRRTFLNIYDRRHAAYAGYLVEQPDETDAALSSVDLVGWIEGRRPLVDCGGNTGVFYRASKRLLDVVGAVALLLLFSPILIATWLVLTAATRGQPIFRQVRIGLGGRRFEMLKFRTMRPDAHLMQYAVCNEQSGPVFKNRSDPRVTPLGNWLRRLSIDELPQLWNVLRGDMSLVGPRPPIPAEVVRYEPWQVLRLSVKPGLTCVWQVSGRSEIQFQDWVRLDLWYVRNQSLLTDLRLLLRTPWSVLSCRGAY